MCQITCFDRLLIITGKMVHGVFHFILVLINMGQLLDYFSHVNFNGGNIEWYSKQLSCSLAYSFDATSQFLLPKLL